MHILIAPNAFKNSLSASDSAEAIRRGLFASGLRCTTRTFPIGDGGDGTAALIIEHLNGYTIDVQTTDPLGRSRMSPIGFVNNGNTAVIELADSSGLRLLQTQELDPLHALSTGTGKLIRAALDKGVHQIILCVGGSATVDGGCGILQALGMKFLGHSQEELQGLPASLSQLSAVDLAGIDKRIFDSELIILCDVNNFLLGEQGAVSVFGPQKGGLPADLLLLETAMDRWREVALLQTGKDMNAIPSGGAAGGIAAALQVFLQAHLRQGIEYFLDITGFDEELEKADLIITGEGSIDRQTLNGKGPYGVAIRAKKKGIPVIGLGGSIARDAILDLDNCFDVLMAIGLQPEDISAAILHTAANLEYTAREIGKLVSIRY